MQKNIARLDIPMDNSLLMGVIEGAADFAQKPRNMLGLHAFIAFMQLAQVRRQRWSTDILHNDVRMSIRGIEVVNLDDVGVS